MYVPDAKNIKIKYKLLSLILKLFSFIFPSFLAECSCTAGGKLLERRERANDHEYNSTITLDQWSLYFNSAFSVA